MEQQITVGDREYTFYTLNAFSIVNHGAKLKRALTQGVTADGLDASVVQLLAGVDEKFLPEIIMPIMKECVVVCTSEGKKVQTEKDINELFTHEDIDELFELIGKVLAVNFGPLVKKTLARFGILLDQLDLKSLIENALKSISAPTSPKN